MAARGIGSSLVKGAAKGIAKNAAGAALGKVFKKSKKPGEEGTQATA